MVADTGASASVLQLKDIFPTGNVILLFLGFTCECQMSGEREREREKMQMLHKVQHCGASVCVCVWDKEQRTAAQ